MLARQRSARPITSTASRKNRLTESASAVVNGVIAAPLLVLVGLTAQNGTIMGGYRSGLLSRVFVWLTAAAMGGAVIAMFLTLGQ